MQRVTYSIAHLCMYNMIFNFNLLIFRINCEASSLIITYPLKIYLGPILPAASISGIKFSKVLFTLEVTVFQNI